MFADSLDMLHSIHIIHLVTVLACLYTENNRPTLIFDRSISEVIADITLIFEDSQKRDMAGSLQLKTVASILQDLAKTCMKP